MPTRHHARVSAMVSNIRGPVSSRKRSLADWQIDYARDARQVGIWTTRRTSTRTNECQHSGTAISLQRRSPDCWREPVNWESSAPFSTRPCLLNVASAIAPIAVGFGTACPRFVSVQVQKQGIGLVKALGMSRSSTFALFST